MADSVLLIDDDVDVLRALGTIIERAGYEVARELGVETGLAAYDRLRPEVVLLDLQLPGMNGLEALGRFRERNASVVLLTGHGDIAAAVSAMQHGAENFLTKPVDADHLLAAVARVAEKVRLRRLNEMSLPRAHPGEGLESLGETAAMRELVRQVGLVAAADRTPVLLTGESGVGKGWLARILHDMGPRAHGPFLEVQAGGREAAALEAELFGLEQSGEGQPRERHQGLIESASGGTLCFDEIGGLPIEIQPRLLRLLEARTFRRIGGTRDLPADVRVIATTSRPLAALVESGAFLEDLAYRLKVMPLALPAVRERTREDRLALLHSLVNALRREVSSAAPTVGPEAVDRLLAHSWPGNVREMRNALERALILSRGHPVVGMEHLPGEFRNRPGLGDRRHTSMTLDALERAHIERTLRHHDGNRTRAALELGISRATLINKIKRYAIDS